MTGNSRRWGIVRLIAAWVVWVSTEIDRDEKNDVSPNAAHDDERHAVALWRDPLEKDCEECVDSNSLNNDWSVMLNAALDSRAYESAKIREESVQRLSNS